MAETETAVELSDAPAPTFPRGHKPDCTCPFCKRARGEPVSRSGGPRTRARPSTRTRATPAREAKSPPNDRAVRAGEFLQMLHDGGDAVWPDPRWELPDDEAYYFGEAAAPVMEKYELADTVLSGGMWGSLVARLFRVERDRAFKIVPEQGLLRTRGRRSRGAKPGGSAEGGDGSRQPASPFPAAPDHSQWQAMTPEEQQAEIDRFKSYGTPVYEQPPYGPVEAEDNGR